MEIEQLTYDKSIQPAAVGCSLRFNCTKVKLIFWRKKDSNSDIKIQQPERGELDFAVENTPTSRKAFIQRTRTRLVNLGLNPEDGPSGGNLHSFRIYPN